MSQITEMGTQVQTVLTSLEDQAIAVFPKFFVGVIIFLFFWLAAGITKKIILKVLSKAKQHHTVAILLGNTAKLIILVIGIITALGTAGINVNAIVASVGLFGFAVGFAFKDFLSNTLAGVMILIYRPFRIHDEITGGEFSGTVKDINLRYTVLNGEEEATVLVPNATMLNHVITIKNRS